MTRRILSYRGQPTPTVPASLAAQITRLTTAELLELRSRRSGPPWIAVRGGVSATLGDPVQLGWPRATIWYPVAELRRWIAGSEYAAIADHVSGRQGLTGAVFGGPRTQEVLTPHWILDEIRRSWGTIALDPCSALSASDVAEECWTGPLTGGSDGLVLPWRDRTYANPPYDQLQDWLACAVSQAHVGRLAVLAPHRTHRSWYRAACSVSDAVVELPSVTFIGYRQPFPAPLALICYGWVPRPDGWRGGAVRRYLPDSPGDTMLTSSDSPVPPHRPACRSDYGVS